MPGRVGPHCKLHPTHSSRHRVRSAVSQAAPDRKLPLTTMAIHTLECCSSNARSCGPALQITSDTLQPSPRAISRFASCSRSETSADNNGDTHFGMLLFKCPVVWARTANYIRHTPAVTACDQPFRKLLQIGNFR